MDTAKVLGHEYRPRVIDATLRRALSASGAVVIEGPRASGKTMTAMHAAGSFVFLDDPEIQTVLDVAPRTLLDGAAPRLLDEWQLAPELWNLVRRAVDATVGPGRFILTGSAVPADDVTRHTGAGRFLRLRQRTMSWWEKLETPSDAVSLADLFAGVLPKTNLAAPPGLDVVIENLLRPGFPAMTGLTPKQSAYRLRGYIDDIARTDIHRIADVRHEPEMVKHLIAARRDRSPPRSRTRRSRPTSGPSLQRSTPRRSAPTLDCSSGSSSSRRNNPGPQPCVHGHGCGPHRNCTWWTRHLRPQPWAPGQAGSWVTSRPSVCCSRVPSCMT